MKRSAIIGFLLTLFSGLLILSATVVFMFQGRQALLQDVNHLNSQRVSLASTVTALEGEVVEQEVALTAAESTRDTLAGQLISSENRVGELQRKEADLTVELNQIQSALAQAEEREQLARESPPLVEIFSPRDGNSIRPGQPLSLLVSASDPVGVITMNLSVNDEPLGSYPTTEGPLFTIQEVWTPPAEGDYTISAIATNSKGRTSQPVTVTITVIDQETANIDLRAQIEANVVEIRGLVPITAVQPTLLTSDELRLRLESDFAEDFGPEEARHDALVLSSFDFISPDFDLYNFWLDLYSEQIAGFYDPETSEFVVISEGERLGAAEQWTHAHEFVHALQDQHFQLGLINDDSLDSEARFALRSLAEGEATLIQFLYLDYFSQAEINEIFAGFATLDTEVLGSAPPVLSASLQFPYNAGFEFVQALYARGGFAAIDAAWANLPQSTEHILHPDRYLAGDNPILVSLAPLTGTLGVGWQLLDEDVFGEFYLREYLKQQLDDREVNTAATGWGGDRYAVYWNETGEALVMVLRQVWDTLADSNEFAIAYGRYATNLMGPVDQMQPDGGRCWQGDDVICLYHDGIETLIVRAPDLTMAARIAAVQQVQSQP